MSTAITERPPAFFTADDPALDFLNSVGAPWGDEIEWVQNGRDLLNWLEEAGIVTSSALEPFRDPALFEEVDKVAAKARDLRDWFRLFVAKHANNPLGSSAQSGLETLNRLLMKGDSCQQLEFLPSADLRNQESTPKVRWRRVWRLRKPDDLLLPLAEVMGNLLSHCNFDTVRNCEGPTCTMWFHDVSKNHTRRWCSMSVCGNRAKAATHRAKKKASRQG